MHWRTRLLHTATRPPAGFASLAPSTHRASTTLFKNTADIPTETWRPDRRPYTYGIYGTPTTLDLAQRIAELEGGSHTLLTPSGQSAIALIYLALTRPGDHVLVTESIYGPNRELATSLITQLGIAVEFYDPLTGAGIAQKLRHNTRLIWCESPGSITMDIQDIPAIAAAVQQHNRAHPTRNSVLALDNTYAAGVLLPAFHLGVDISMQAVTKYIGGHSDILLGAITTAPEDAADPTRIDNIYEAIGSTHRLLGIAVSPGDCTLALRGMQTLSIRLAALEHSTVTLAQWLATCPEVAEVLHPALPTHPQHALFSRDFAASASLFSIVFRQGTTQQQVVTFVDTLRLFKIGYSWGGTTSLVMPYLNTKRITQLYGPRLVRLNIGLEDPADLQQDLQAALTAAFSI